MLMVLLAGSFGEAFAITVMAVTGMGLSFKLLQPLMQGLGRRLGGGDGGRDPAVHEELAEMRARLQELEAQQARMLELEERLDFTERLLVQQREQEAGRLLPGGER